MAYHIMLALFSCLFGLGPPLLWSFLLSLSLFALTFACSLTLPIGTGSRSLVALGGICARILNLTITLAPSFPTAASASATTASLSLLLCRVLLRPRSPSDMGKRNSYSVG